MKVILPMAGRGARFCGTNYSKPKPLIDVVGLPMFVRAIESLKNIVYDELIIIALREHLKFNLVEKIALHIQDKYQLVLLDEVTEGQLCTILKARDFLKPKDDLLIISSDTIIKSELGNDILQYRNKCDGIISVSIQEGDHWSFAQVNSEGNVIDVAEKIRISQYASTGMYYFSNAEKFLKYSDEIIDNKAKTKGEYYVIPVYKKYIENGFNIQISLADFVWDLGNPKGLHLYINQIL